eukprot:7385809-Prymnesium_polylepis.2
MQCFTACCCLLARHSTASTTLAVVYLVRVASSILHSACYLLLTTRAALLTPYHSPSSVQRLPARPECTVLATYYSLLVPHYLLLTDHPAACRGCQHALSAQCLLQYFILPSLLTTCYTLLTTRYSPFTTHCLPLV